MEQGRSFSAVKHSTNSDPTAVTVIQLVPRYGSEPTGIGDYAECLARTLRACAGINSVFLSGMASSEPPEMKNDWKTYCVPHHEPQNLADTLRVAAYESKARVILLHFSGYGYQQRGVPLWLLQGLRIWRYGETHVPILTIFHELYATGRPWNSSFWLSPLQRRIARNVLNLSSGAITATSFNQEWLQDRNRNHAEIIRMPVFSNIGEPGSGRAPCARAGTAVVFGLAGVEDRLYGGYRKEIEHVLMTRGIEKIIDIGPRHGTTPSRLAGVPIISKGALPQASVSELLQQARYGFVAYPLNAIGKSGVFAAYAAHGVIPIVFSEKRGPFEGLEAGRNFIDGLQLEHDVEADTLASIQSELSIWYASHSLLVQAELLEKCIMSKVSVRVV